MASAASPEEINKLVTAHIFGTGTFRRFKDSNGPLFVPYGSEVNLQVSDLKDFVPDFCTGPVACRKLKLKMRDQGWLYAIRVFECGEVGVQFWKNGDDPHTANMFNAANAQTEEMAVALAALRAYGVPV
jgi:hypothetical protein